MSFKIIFLILFLWAEICFCESRFICPTREGLFANPINSISFYQCNEGIAYLKSCPANLVYNAARSYCDWPVGNAQANNQPKDTSSSGYGHNQQGPSSVHMPTGIQIDKISHKIEGFTCPLSHGMFQIEGHCNRFVHCENGIAFLKDCPQGLYFSPKALVCDWPNNVNCVQSTKPSKTFRVVKPHFLNNPNIPRPDWNNIPAQNLNPIAPPVPGTNSGITSGWQPNQPRPNGSERPYSADNHNPISIEKPERPNIKPETPSSEESPSSSQTNNNYVCDWCFKCPTMRGFFENEYDDQTYYECVNGEAFMLYCAKGMAFSSSKGHCIQRKEGYVDPTTLINARIGVHRQNDPKPKPSVRG